jgi:hypothetical protein
MGSQRWTNCRSIFGGDCSRAIAEQLQQKSPSMAILVDS